MQKIEHLVDRIRIRLHLPKPQRQCSCHENDPPPWTGEIHGLSQVGRKQRHLGYFTALQPFSIKQ